MNEPRELHECGRCGAKDRTVRLHLANLAREARLDHRPHSGPHFDLTYRCATCREAVRPPRNTDR